MDRNFQYTNFKSQKRTSLSARRAWIEIWSAVLTELLILSLSARRAWIEICICPRLPWLLSVALRKESVDRNNRRLGTIQHTQVALRKESVDRNCVGFSSGAKADRSLSARRAWIEIASGTLSDTTDVVALRKESVDRNLGTVQIVIIVVGRSPQGERG